MKRYLPYLLSFFFLLSSFVLKSQDFGSFPPGMKWMQMNSKNLRVIFPKGLESQARQVSNTIQHEDANNRISIGPLSKKLNLILNNQGVISNGYVATMPYRSEFYTTPPQDGNSLGTMDWLTLLSIHEYRHALQYINLRRGINKLAWYLSGEAGWGTMMTLAVPQWFFEGDAVVTETALSDQGRGRVPFFMSQYKSILLDSTNYTYMKAQNGSFRDYVPDHYTLGYLLCSYGRDSFGNDFWKNVLGRTAWYRGIIYPFSNAVMKYTKLSTRKLYKKAFNEYREQWHIADSLLVLTPSQRLDEPRKTITSYRYPVFLDNGDLLVCKYSYDETESIYRRKPDGTEEHLCETGIAQDRYFTTGGPWVAWAEVSWDPRFSSISYSDIVLYNTETQSKTYLTRHQRFFSPAVSPDGKWVMVVEADHTNQYKIQILDIQSGKIQQTLPNPENAYYTFPKWDLDGKSLISAIRTSSGAMYICRQQLNTGAITPLTRSINHIIGEVVVSRESILYSATYSGINNIYSLDRKTGSIRQMTSTRFGAYYPAISPDGKTLVYSEFTRKGYHLMSASIQLLPKRIVNPKPLDQLPEFSRAYQNEEGGNILGKIEDMNVPVKPYKPWLHFANIHSWTLSPTTQSVALDLISDNILSDFHMQGGAAYYWNEDAFGFNAGVQYGGFFPILGLSFSRNYRSPGAEAEDPRAWVEDIGAAQFSIPLNFSKGLFYKQAGISAGYNLISYQEVAPDDFNVIGELETFHSLVANLRYVQTKKQAYQNITTPLGFGIELSAKQSISSIYAGQFMAFADAAIRGFRPNHNFVVSAAWKYEPADNDYTYLDLFLYPRGYSIPVSNWMVTVQSSYHFPLLYPDFGFAGIFYCSRIRANVFADYGYADIPYTEVTDSYGLFLSAGTEIILDTRWLNLLDFPMGFRFSFLATPDFADSGKRFSFEFVIPVIRL